MDEKEGGVGLADPEAEKRGEVESALISTITSLVTDKMKEEKTEPEPDPYVETYFKVMFQMKSNPQEPNDVTISVNGEVLHMQRGVEVIIPKRYLGACDDAYYETFEQMPGKDRKVTARVSVYAYTVLGPSTEKAYLAKKKEGDLATRAVLKIKSDGMG